MRINKITTTPPLIPQNNTFKGKNGIFIPNTKEQPKYLYNKMLDVMHDCKIGGTIKNEGIDLPSVTQKVLDKLKEFSIKFIDK